MPQVSKGRNPTILEAAGVALLSVAVAIVVGAISNLYVSRGGTASPLVDTIGLAPQLAFVLCMMVGVLLWARMTGSSSNIRWQRPRSAVSRAVTVGAVVGAGLQGGIVALLYGFTRLFPSIDPSEFTGAMERAIRDSPLSTRVVLVIIAVLFAPFSEELFYRGMLISALNNRMGRTGTLLLSSALFGLAHFNIYSFLLLSLVGLTFGVLILRTESLITSIAAHITFNSIAVIGLVAMTS